MFDENYNNIQNEFKNIDYNNYNANQNDSNSNFLKQNEPINPQGENSNLSNISKFSNVSKK